LVHIERLESLALRFRRAAENIARRGDVKRLDGFPHGRCKDASIILARVIAERTDAEDIRYVWGYLGDGDKSTHGWLRVHGVNVDVTADQFSEAPAPVLVSVTDRFHDLFRFMGKDDPYPRLWENLREGVDREFLDAYGAIMAELDRVIE